MITETAQSRGTGRQSDGLGVNVFLLILVVD